MTISLANVKTNVAHTPPMTLIYGTHGVGKTTFVASAPNPIFIQAEDGLGMLEVPTFGVLKSFDHIMEAIGSLYSEKHNYQTLGIDSADHLEPLIWAQACKDNGWANIEAPGYGKGYVAALDLWRSLLDGLIALREERGMSVFIIAHSEVKRYDAPDSEPYDRYIPKLHKGAAALLQEVSDIVLFATYRMQTVKSEVGFGKKVTRAVGGGDRVLYTEERPAYLAKQRYNLPPAIPMDWAQFAAGVPYYKTLNVKG